MTQVRERQSWWTTSHNKVKIGKCKITGGNWLTTLGGAAKSAGLIGGSVAWSDLVCSKQQQQQEHGAETACGRYARLQLLCVAVESEASHRSQWN